MLSRDLQFQDSSLNQWETQGQEAWNKDQTHIYIVTGKINAGKTTKLSAIYDAIGVGDGFILPKIFEENQYIGQRILRLSTRESEYFSFKKEFLPILWDEEYSYGVYSFSRQGLLFASKITLDIITKKIEPIFIDEIGPLELQGKGFANILKQVLPLKKEIYITARNSCIKKIIKEFNIKEYTIINV